MYLKQISIKNFRAFNDTGIDVIFNKGVNAIIGENNSGKSTLIDAIRIAFSTIPYSKDIYFTKADFHINQRGEKAHTSLFDIYLEDVPQNLIEIWNPEAPTTGEFHLRFYTDITPAGITKVKYKAWGGKTEGNPLSPDTFDAMNIAFLGALRDAENEMRPSRTSKLASLLTTITTDEKTKDDLVNELQKANSAILKMEPIKKTKAIINSNLSDIEQDLLHQQIDIGLVDPKFESVASSLRSWIVPRWFFIESNFKYFKILTNKCNESGLPRLFQLLMNHSFELYQNGLGYNNLKWALPTTQKSKKR